MYLGTYISLLQIRQATLFTMFRVRCHFHFSAFYYYHHGATFAMPILFHVISLHPVVTYMLPHHIHQLVSF